MGTRHFIRATIKLTPVESNRCREKIVFTMNEGESVPYYKDYTNNAIRGAITAACFATFFLIIAVINHFKWKPPVDGDSLNEYDLQCEEKEERDEKDIVKISECVQPFDADIVKVKPFDAEVVKDKPCDSQEIVQPFDTEKLAEERVLVEKIEVEEEEEEEEEEKVGTDNLGFED